MIMMLTMHTEFPQKTMPLKVFLPQKLRGMKLMPQNTKLNSSQGPMKLKLKLLEIEEVEIISEAAEADLHENNNDTLLKTEVSLQHV